MAERLYGAVLRTSVSRLEEFASCPFRFFVHSGLRANERKMFELDARERGSFQHDALKLFHDQLAANKMRWRDVTPQEARERIGQIARLLSGNFRDGLMRDSPQTHFAAKMLVESLQDFVEVIVTWMREQYEFDPVAVELEFGSDASPSAGIALGDGHKLLLRGRIDRVDLFREADGDEGLAVVVDYKSGEKSLDATLMQHGVQLQLPAYLNVLRRENPRSLGAARIRPAGVFYANLHGKHANAPSRVQALDTSAAARKAAYRHTGRFDAGMLAQLDKLQSADQFNYRLKGDGALYANSTEALSRAAFEKLLDRVDILLVEMGRRIYAGDAAVDPYRKGKRTPCEDRDYRTVCRIDPWTHQVPACSGKRRNRMKLTEAQQTAVNARGNVLVSAAAGTGKTGTLVARCLQYLCDERPRVSLDEILVVTFTEAAATEMRERLRARLEEKLYTTPEDPHWAEQLALFDAAHIGTLHGLCFRLIRRHFYELKLDPQVSVLADGEARLLADECIDAVLQHHYAGRDQRAEAVQELIQSYGSKGDRTIRALLLRLHDYAQTRANPSAWMEAQTRMFAAPEPEKWRQWLLEGIAAWREESVSMLRHLANCNEKAPECADLLAALPERFSRDQAAACLAQLRTAGTVWPTGRKTALQKPLERFFETVEFFSSLAESSAKMTR